MQAERREISTAKQDRDAAQDRTRAVLDGAVKRLRRLGGRRSSREMKQAYRQAADLVKGVMPRKR